MAQSTPDEKRRVLLRTTADIMAHALIQMECCAAEWPEYVGEVEALRNLCLSLTAQAREVGYVGRGARR